VKAQFLLISAVVAGSIIIAIAGTISEAQGRKYASDTQLPYNIDSVRDEARRLDLNDPQDRRRFRRAVSTLGYSSSVTYWGSRNCFNVTLKSSERSATLTCIS